MHINSFAQFWHCWLYQQRNSWGGKYNFGVRMYAFYCKNTENILRKITSWKIISFLCTHFHCTPENLERLTKKKSSEAADNTEMKSNQWITALDNVWTLYIPSIFSSNLLFIFSKLMISPKGCMLFNSMSLM